MHSENENTTDTAKILKYTLLLGLILTALVVHLLWKWLGPDGKMKRLSEYIAVESESGKVPVTQLTVGKEAVTADEARSHLRKWAEETFQVSGLSPEPPHLPKDRWIPFAKAMVETECDSPTQLSAQEIRSLAQDLAPVAREHPVSATLVARVLLGETGSQDLLETAIKKFDSEKGAETTAMQAAVALALISHQSEDEKGVEKRYEAALRAIRRALDAEAGYSKYHDRVAAHILMGGMMSTFFESMHDQVTEEVKKTAGAKLWLKKWIEGENCLKRAWEARGGGLANTVTDNGMGFFHRESEKARRLLVESWAQKPQTPQPAETLIYAGLSLSGDRATNHMRQWMNEVLKLQVDSETAPEHLLWGLRPRWHGSHAAMESLGRACVKTGRFDSSLPWTLLKAHRDISSEWDLPNEYFKALSDFRFKELQAVFEGAEAEPKRESWREIDRTHAAIFSFQCRRYTEAARWLEKLGFKLNRLAASEWPDLDADLLVSKTAAYGTPKISEILVKAETDDLAFRQEPAIKGYAEALAIGTPTLKEVGLAYINQRISAMKIESAFGAGTPVQLVPAEKGFTGWTEQGGGWKIEDGAWLHLGREIEHITSCEARIGSKFTLDGEIEVTEPGDETQFWIAHGYPDRGLSGRWMALRFHWEGDKTYVMLSEQMEDPVEMQKIEIGPRFKFKLRCHPGGISLHVDDKPVLENTPIPPGYVKERYASIGIGAVCESERTRVRIHKLQLHR